MNELANRGYHETTQAIDLLFEPVSPTQRRCTLCGQLVVYATSMSVHVWGHQDSGLGFLEEFE